MTLPLIDNHRVRMTTESIEIRPTANNHGLFLIVVGSALFLITLFIAQWYWHSFRLVFIALFLIFTVIIFTGILKRSQPTFSISLTKNYFIFIHKFGRWQLSWHEIAYIAPVTSISGIDSQELPYVGIKLKDEAILERLITHRLANRLIHEQRPLLIWALNHELLTLDQSLINFSPYQGVNGVIKGPRAGFLHQAKALKHAFGFKLFIHKSALDRELTEFCQLVKQCQRYALDNKSTSNIRH